MLKINKTTEKAAVVNLDVLWRKDLSLVAKGVYMTVMNHKGCIMELEELYDFSDTKEEIDNAIKELTDNGLIKFEE